MSQKHIAQLLRPKSVAVIGASNNPKRAGFVMMRNLLQGGFSGPIMPVTPKYKAVSGVLAYASIDDLPAVPDLAILCTSARRVPDIIDQLGIKGTRSAIVLAAGLSNRTTEDGLTIKDAMMECARRHGVRILGPNSLGMIIPSIGLNASFSHTPALPGKIALISQSAAICTTILDWAKPKGIGFSNFISLGDASDVDFGELIDYLCRDTHTRAIMLCIDSIQHRRSFMSAARAASRNKPVLVFKAGSTHEGAIATHLHTGGISGSDAAYDAAIRRSGMLRVRDLHELFAAVETLAHDKPLKGEKLAIITNGGGPAVMAIDTLIERQGRLAEFSDELKDKLCQVMPPGWLPGNPIDLLGDAPPKRYADVLKVLLEANEADAILLMHAPAAAAPATEYANAVIDTLSTCKPRQCPNIFTNWTGEETVQESRKLFARANIPNFRTPAGAVGAFMHMVQYRRNQKLLLETPESVPENVPSDISAAHTAIAEAIAQNNMQLETHDAGAILSSYGIPTIPTLVAENPEQAASLAKQLSFPIALKVICEGIRYKSEVGGVVLNLNSSAEVLTAAEAMLERVTNAYPDAQVDGLALQPMAQRSGSQEIRIAVQTDPVFGPIILLGEGGSDWDTARDAAVALPPLNMALARYLVIEALAENKLKDRRLPQGLDRDALCILLTQVSHLITDCPEIVELDLNPALASGSDIVVLDTTIKLQPTPEHPAQRMAIRPYPKALEEWRELRNGEPVLLRPIRPEDEPSHKAFDLSLTREDRYKRFFGEVGEMTHEAMAHLTQIDYDREMAFIATQKDNQGMHTTLGVVRIHIDPDNTEAEFAVILRPNMQGQGLGRMLMEKVINYCKEQQIEEIMGYTMPENRGMIELSRKLGFKVKFMLEDGMVEMRMPFNSG
ncbi:bifunctional acetate--CoA ligase family protein/GNAT family N-acetyltransferase [Aestuariirhabdus sp. Z084]|uniref:bifunctional acetate--CoA ligase family protein/GNAT family N-acetyltransferase n=1 Tax=Aestuariirhabdus haliotis TaxID=2918751 RepID=UPI00201B3C7E|nr:bifunctional acetate--CoA ligase family protein/GNAT family N-acetyltransferase [Aestuariirhabdus haliotis]MCL6415899.1 bifunctional acetate--CoA ligase family protein/GNAT family N-acetyltransferase [Aestuariirhabdus haliotis]MCL6419897.1 bifunctional acetate--CoA ligase family protein/GNAT family N-acetyltransferase [Aestuariirhabdus haliotis]